MTTLVTAAHRHHSEMKLLWLREPHGEPSKRFGDLVLESPPHEGLDELMGREDQGQRSQGEFGPTSHMAKPVQADGADDDPGGHVRLG